jgi:hypothetical protein
MGERQQECDFGECNGHEEYCTAGMTVWHAATATSSSSHSVGLSLHQDIGHVATVVLASTVSLFSSSFSQV